MLQVHPVYSLCNRRKTLTGSPDPTRANGTNKPCISSPLHTPQGAALCHKKSCLAVNHDKIHLLHHLRCKNSDSANGYYRSYWVCHFTIKQHMHSI